MSVINLNIYIKLYILYTYGSQLAVWLSTNPRGDGSIPKLLAPTV